MAKGNAIFGFIAIAAIVGACNNAFGTEDNPSKNATSSTTSVSVATPTPQEAECYGPTDKYTGFSDCVTGGEIVNVDSVIDGDTIKLTDGRTVRLLAVDAPLLKQCAGQGAAAFTREKVADGKVKLYQEPGTDRDERGNLWRYVAYSDRTDSNNLPYFSEDLGRELVSAGWAKLRSGGENADYLAAIKSAADSASYQSQGMYAPPCGKPKVYGDDDGNGVADYDEQHHVNGPNVNLPDGALTGGYCARKWWC